MSEQNVTMAVASGDSPQPNSDAAKATNLDAESYENEMFPESEEQHASSEETTEAAIDAAQKAGDITKQEAKELKKKLKLKVDGKEIEEELDFNDDEGLKRHLQKSKAFDKRSQEFASYKNQVDQLVQLLQNDPEAFLEKAGINVDQLSEKRIQKRIEEMSKSPEQIEREKMQKELEDLRKEKKRIEEEKTKAEEEKLRNKYASEVESELEDLLGSGKFKLPQKNLKVMQRVAQTMLSAMDAGFSNVSVKDVLPLVEKEWMEELRSYFDTSTEDLIEEMVGKTNLDRLRKKRLAARPKPQSAKQIIDTGKKAEVEDEDRPKKKMKDFFNLD